MSGEQLIREIGRSGVRASAVGLGTWAIGGWMWGGTDEAQSITAIQASLDAGVTLIDTAPAYGLGRSEEIVGKAIAGCRDKAVIATKCGLVWHTRKGKHFFDQDGKPVHRYLGRDAIIHEVEESLRRLGTDYIDLYITHWQDPTTPIEETVAALDDLKQAGKIRAVGASNVNRSELEHYVQTGALDAIQERFSMIDREIEQDLLPLTTANNVSTLSYSSLALGLLSGMIGPERVFSGDDQRKDNPRFSVANRQKAKDFATAIKPVADRHGATIAQIVIAWTLAQPGVTFALCGARNPAQALDNAQAGRLRLSSDDLAAIDTAISAQLVNMDG
ncbi:aldo/keto reductase [Brucella anthropi]|jgi:methylglyoxal reductase|uniref:Aldo/keto reductase n=1 Tax=Brucella anthropi TaxID=529 RepID=A0A8I0N276_BRUAN|nr:MULTISPECIES: aldo/keto reductase [Brucella/Ochrobactrum group]MCR5941440.1 aldo/keto reductase [Ochrobactrum sp. XJ1]QTN05338.1 aldo/keto reductase [Ochrobactrum sp. EEELCW01]KAB2757269.1 aldo/keto reductase [Brucella anthropi]KAB2768440.1 aldo/keto reductase [Brucella anthropi]MBA8861195.1 aryl-alcohol dehydrogenase-like predicted oxidoreductase [Brucella anthropi]